MLGLANPDLGVQDEPQVSRLCLEPGIVWSVAHKVWSGIYYLASELIASTTDYQRVRKECALASSSLYFRANLRKAAVATAQAAGEAVAGAQAREHRQVAEIKTLDTELTDA